MKFLRHFISIFGLVLCGTIGQAQIGGPGEGSNWEVLPVILAGTNTYYNWYQGTNGPVSNSFSSLWGSGPPNAVNSTSHSLTARMVSDGTITVRIKWIGTGAQPTSVWVKVQGSAYFGPGLLTPDEPEVVSGTASNGLDDAVVPAPAGGGISSGQEYFKLSVGSNGIAEKTIALNTTAYRTAPWANVSAGCGANNVSPDPFVF